MSEGEWQTFCFDDNDLIHLIHHLTYCNNMNTLIECLLLDKEWLIPFDYRLAIMKKAKDLGANSKPFLIDYYGYKAAFLDPTDEQIYARAMLDKLSSYN